MRIKNIMLKVLIWRLRHMSNRNFVLLLSGLIGIITGVAAVALKEIVHLIQRLLTQGIDYTDINFLYLFYPLIGLLVTLLIARIVNEKMGHGITDILYSISKKSSVIRKTKMYSRLVTSAVTVGFGGSVGLEAPIVVTGSAIGSNIARLVHLDYKSRTLLIGCGAAGAISGIFNSPVAGVIFAAEVILTEVRVTALAPLLIASVGGALVSFNLLGEDVLFSFNLQDSITTGDIPFFFLLGITTGLISVYFTRVTYWTESLMLKAKSGLSKVLVGGIVLGVIILVLPPIYGEGYNSIKSLLAGQGELLLKQTPFTLDGQWEYILIVFLALILVVKPVASAVTIGSGGSGGIFAPSLFMGGVAGFLFAFASNVFFGTSISLSNFTLVGMCGVMSGVLQAPLTAIFLIAEITSGYTLFVPLMLVSAIAFSVMHYFENYSLYVKQLIQRGDYIAFDKDRQLLSKINLRKIVEKDLLTINEESTLAELVERVKFSRRNIFPVINHKMELKGIITLDDIREIMFDETARHEIQVKTLMHAPPASISSQENMQSVMNKFQLTGAWNLPVIDNGKYIGVISKSRIFNTYRQKLMTENV